MLCYDKLKLSLDKKTEHLDKLNFGFWEESKAMIIFNLLNLKTNNMKIKLSFLFAALSAVTFLHAQEGASKKQDIESIQKRTLVVVTEEADEKLLAKLEGDMAAQYKKDIEDYNRDIKAAVTGFWKFNDKIEYKTRAEMGKLTKAKSKDYAYIEYSKFSVNTYNATAYKCTYQFKEGAKQTMAMESDYNCTLLNIRLSENKPRGYPVYGVKMPGAFPDKADLVYALKAMQRQFAYKLEGKKDYDIFYIYKENAKLLPAVTLLVNENNTALNIDEIKKAYPYPVELVKKDKINEALLNSDEKTAFVIMIPHKGDTYSFEIHSAKDCTLLGFTTNTQSEGATAGRLIGGSIGGVIAMQDNMTKTKMKKEHFQLFTKHVK